MRRILGIFLVIISAFTIFAFSMSVETSYLDKIVYENFNEYVQTDLLSNEEGIDNIEEKIILTLVLNYDRFDKESVAKNHPSAFRENATSKDVDAFRCALKEKGKDHHSKNNKSIEKELKIKNYESKYVSEFLPLVEYTFDKNVYEKNSKNILKFSASSDKVKEVYVRNSCEEMYEDQGIRQALTSANAYVYYENRTFTGEGVTIGLLEANGVIDTSSPTIVGSNYEIFDQSGKTESVSEHATHMAGIMAGAKGVAPDAKVLSVQLFGTMSEEFDWMINKGASIINMSFNEANATGIYKSDSALCDYIVKNYNVTIVSSAGNEGEGTGKIGNPALGYNTITVGSYTDGSGVDSFSSYKVLSGPEKPTLAVSGVLIEIPNIFGVFTTGTSQSAAITSGIIAMLMEQIPQLKTQPAKVISLLVANSRTIKDDENITYSKYNGFDQYVGAGVINLASSIQQYGKSIFINNSLGVNGTYVVTRSIYLNAGQTIKAAAVWLANADGTASGTSFTNYDIRLFDDNGYILTLGASNNTNIEMLEYTATVAGHYSLRVYQRDAAVDLGGQDQICLTYSIR